jgi:hypothetical protein
VLKLGLIASFLKGELFFNIFLLYFVIVQLKVKIAMNCWLYVQYFLRKGSLNLRLSSPKNIVARHKATAQYLLRN